MKDGAAIVRDGITQLLPYGQINLVKTIASELPEVGQSVPGWINLNYTSFGLDMAANPWSMVTGFTFTWAAIGLILIPIIAGGSQWLMTKITMKHQPQTDPAAVQNLAESNGFSVVRDLVGHGIGKEMHEDPQVPNYGKAGKGLRLKRNMTLAIEPMINEGTYEVSGLDDGWTVVTDDDGYSAHYENTVVVTENGCEILSL